VALKVFISHPFTDNPNKNREKVDLICKNLSKITEVMNEKILFISPLHLWYFMESDMGLRKDILEYCLHLIDGCDEVWFFSYDLGDNENIEDSLSAGQLIEKNHVEDNNIKYKIFGHTDDKLLKQIIKKELSLDETKEFVSKYREW